MPIESTVSLRIPVPEIAEPTRTAEAQQLQPRLVDINGLAVMLGRSVPALERDQAAGRLPAPVRIGRSKKWRLAEIDAWIEAGCPARRTWEIMQSARRARP